MTHLRHPNRRPNASLDEALNGGLCRATGKIRYLSSRAAGDALGHLAVRDPDPQLLNAYRCDGCGDWHVGHRVLR